MESLCEAGAGLRAACGLAGAGLGSGGGTCGWRAGPRSWQERARVLRHPWGDRGAVSSACGRLPLRWGNLNGGEAACRKRSEQAWDGALRAAFRAFEPAGVLHRDQDKKNSHFACSNDRALQNKF